jgi:germination protein M
MLTGCSTKEEAAQVTEELPDGWIYVYYIDGDEFELVTEDYELESDETDAKNIAHILTYMLSGMPGDKANLMASAMTMIRFSYDEEENQVRITVNVANELNDQYIEMLTKAAITNTLCQLDYVDTIRFEIYDSSTMMDDHTYEIYDKYSFVNAEEEGGSLQRGVITIYFANETGDKLIEYDKAVEITNNVSLEQLVIESLITGPLREGYAKTIPDGTSLKRISIKDGVCYVDLSGEFNGTLDTCMDVVTIYSVVNSLCELPTINKVQFLIDGEKQEFYRETLPMDGMFEFQNELIEDMEDED